MHIPYHVTISAVAVPPTADVPGPSGLTYASNMVSGDYRTLGKRQDNPNVQKALQKSDMKVSVLTEGIHTDTESELIHSLSSVCG